MAKHEIDVRIPQEIWVEHKDLEVQVKANGRRLGRLHISRGTVDWIPVNSQSGYRMRWERFDKAHPTYPQSLDASRLVLDFDDAERWSIPEGC